MRPFYSRRQFLHKLLHNSAFGWIAGMVACGQTSPSTDKATSNDPPTSCDDLSGLSEQDLQLRKTYGYVTESPVTGSQCSNCNLWLPNATDPNCGKCLLFQGPVYAAGHCTSWAPQN